MKTALVMGITGGFGGSCAQALARQGWSIRALMRDPARLPERFRGAEVIKGDAGDIDAVRSAARGVDLVVYAVNPPRYNWKGIALPMLENIATVAEEQGLTVLFPANVYVFNPADGPNFDEQTPMHPVSPKGKTRKAMEDRLRLASERGARIIVLRMGDYIGENAPSAWMGVLLKRSPHGFSLSTTGPRDLPHTWAYLPDAARVAAELAARRKDLPAWSVFHYRGYRVSFNEIADTLQRATGRQVKLKRFPWWALRIMAPFSVLFRGLLEMRYLWNHEVNLDDSALQQVLGGPVPQTPLGDALLESGFATDDDSAVSDPAARGS
jgi:nucleoside-diphosphate-sugar epimerase